MNEKEINAKRDALVVLQYGRWEGTRRGSDDSIGSRWSSASTLDETSVLAVDGVSAAGVVEGNRIIVELPGGKFQFKFLFQSSSLDVG